MKNQFYRYILLFLLSSISCISLNAQLIHPGLAHTKSDLDRMKYQVEAKIEPFYTSYINLSNNSLSDYNYNVQGDVSLTTYYRDAPATNRSKFESDSRAAYNNALMWYITGDTRHAEKAIECLNAWTGLTYCQHNGTRALTAGMAFIMIEAAEIIKSTYSGWSQAEIKNFGDMLVYPGYSNTTVPSNLGEEGTWYWRGYMFDKNRAGNQELHGIRVIMAIGVFLDNEIIYDRALRYVQGLPHRNDDLAYASGPSITNGVSLTSPYKIVYNNIQQETIPDYGFNGVLTNYIYENGQCDESYRDQNHSIYGIGNLAHTAEIAWNQGDDLYGWEDSRLLLGLEYTTKYNLSYLQSYPDQTTPWEPTVESGEFIQRVQRTARNKALAINPFVETNYDRISRGGFLNSPFYEMVVNHYAGRGLKQDEDAKWIIRNRDYYIDKSGYEGIGQNGSLGWGGLTERRPEQCYGEPINGFDTDGLPDYNMNVLPATIEAENFDYSPVNGEGRTYHDNVKGNKGNEYRTEEDVDIQICSEGGYTLGWMEPGEWFTYTVYVPETGTYDLSIRYAANSADGTIGFSFGGEDKTGEVPVPSSAGWDNWEDLVVAEGVLLTQGVQSLRIQIGGTKAAFNLNNISIGTSNSCVKGVSGLDDYLEPGIKYNYYEGVWNNLPEFENLEILDSGITTGVGLGNGEIDNGFGYEFDGYVYLDAEGDYTFYTTSDDGSNLAIDGVEIVNNDGTHAAIEESGSICLQSGYHKIKVEYFEKTGGSDVLEVKYEGPSLTKQSIDELYYLPSDVVLSTNIIEGVINEVGVFPNPFENTITVKINNISNSRIEVLNSLGEIIFLDNTNEKTTNIDLANLSSGFYEIRVVNDNGVVVKKIIKN